LAPKRGNDPASGGVTPIFDTLPGTFCTAVTRHH
jgi:hypothetical protein